MRIIVSKTASVGRMFDVYRIKISENRDRQEDVEAKCRHYEAGRTYRDCVLASIKHNFEVSSILNKTKYLRLRLSYEVR